MLHIYDMVMNVGHWDMSYYNDTDELMWHTHFTCPRSKAEAIGVERYRTS